MNGRFVMITAKRRKHNQYSADEDTEKHVTRDRHQCGWDHKSDNGSHWFNGPAPR